jgi:hypothetical protein
MNVLSCSRVVRAVLTVSPAAEPPTRSVERPSGFVRLVPLTAVVSQHNRAGRGAPLADGCLARRRLRSRPSLLYEPDERFAGCEERGCLAFVVGAASPRDPILSLGWLGPVPLLCSSRPCRAASSPLCRNGTTLDFARRRHNVFQLCHPALNVSDPWKLSQG